MKILIIIYVVILLIIFGVQVLFSLGDSDQSVFPWKLIIKQSILWPWYLVKILFYKFN